MARRFMEIVLVIVAAVTLIIAVLALIVTYLTARFPQAVAEAIRLPTPLPEIIERTVVATATPGPMPTPVVEKVEQVVTVVVEVTRVVPVEVTRVVVETATPAVNAAVAAFEEDFTQLDTSNWDVRSGDWETVSGQLSLPYDEDVPAEGVLVAGFDTWDNYSVEMNVSGLYDYPIGDDQTIGQTCYFAVPSSQEGYSSDFMNGTPKAFDSDGNPRSRFACRPGNWISRAALLVGADRTGPIAGLIIGEN